MVGFWNVRWSPLAYVVSRLKELKGSGQPYLTNVKSSAYEVHLFLGSIYSRGLKFLQVTYNNFDCDLTHGLFIHDFNKNLFMMT